MGRKIYVPESYDFWVLFPSLHFVFAMNLNYSKNQEGNCY